MALQFIILEHTRPKNVKIFNRERRQILQWKDFESGEIGEDPLTLKSTKTEFVMIRVCVSDYFIIKFLKARKEHSCMMN